MFVPGTAKYEHQHKAIVWRVPRLPKQGQGSYTNHEFVCRLTLTSFDQMPENFEKFCYLEFTQPATAESYTVLRSVSVSEGSGKYNKIKGIVHFYYKWIPILGIRQLTNQFSCLKLVVKKKNLKKLIYSTVVVVNINTMKTTFRFKF